jgi:uncharacterized protein YndB with AHSA1/START domain
MDPGKRSTRSTHVASRRHLITTATLALAGITLRPIMALAQADDGISRTAEAIHQQRQFKAEPARVYEALTVSKQFDRIIQLSGVMQSAAMSKMSKPTSIGRHVGEAFALFGGYIVGRQIELVPGRRIVQAWRAENWESGVYSIARFELVPQGTGTTVTFDHAGFPSGDAGHLAEGWQAHYWEPLEKFLS